MEYSVFYAWQADSPQSTNKYLIRDALATALGRIRSDATVDLAPRPDHDTRGESGTPAIAETIFSKIDGCGVFLADVTLVGATPEGKRLPNPNVLIELGYAAARIGWSRIILVLNEQYGEAKDLPFDIVHRRWPLAYAANGCNELAGVKRALSHTLESAVRAAQQTDHLSVERVRKRLDSNSLEFLNLFGKEPGFHSPSPSETAAHHVLQQPLFNDIVRRLLDLHLLETHVDAAANRYSYNWSYLGVLTLQALGVRSQPEIEGMPGDLANT